MAKLTELPADLHPDLAEALAADGIESLYSHQAEAYETAHSARPDPDQRHRQRQVAVSFNLPGAGRDRARARSGARSTSTPPRRWPRTRPASSPSCDPPGLREAIYDGDTPREDRPAIRRRSNLVLTNPDMLNVGLLPHHKRWGDFLAEPRLGRRGRGPHLPRRLRLARGATCCGGCGASARMYGAEPRFVMASATIANPTGAGRATDRARVRAAGR